MSLEPITRRNARRLKRLLDVPGFSVLTGNALAFSPDSRYLAYGGLDFGEAVSRTTRLNREQCAGWPASVLFLELGTGEVACKLPSTHQRDPHVFLVEFSPDGKHFLSMDSDGWYVWGIDLPEQVELLSKRWSCRGESLDPRVSCGTFDPLGAAQLGHLYIVDADNLLVLRPRWNGVCVHEEFQLPSPTSSWKRRRIMTSDASRIVLLSPAAGNGCEVTVSEPQRGGEEWSFELPLAFPDAACFHPSGNLFAVSADDVVTVWALQDEELLAELPQGAQAESLVFSPDGSLLAVGAVERTNIWAKGMAFDDAPDRKEAWSLGLWDWKQAIPLVQMPTAGGCGAIAFSSDGRYLAFGGHKYDTGSSVEVLAVEKLPSGRPPPSPPPYDSQGRDYAHPYYGIDD